MALCPKCSREFQGNFCRICGVPLISDAAEMQRLRSRRSRKRILGFGATIGLAAIVVGAVTFAYRTARPARAPGVVTNALRGEATWEVPPSTISYVSDEVGVIDHASIGELDGLISELKAKTGGEIAVVVINSTAPLSAFDYAMKIAETRKPGAVGKDNGVVFLVAVKDHQMFILTGRGVAQGVLPDSKVAEIRDTLVRPAFRLGDYTGGIRAATEAMAALIARGEGVELARLPPAGALHPQGAQ